MRRLPLVPMALAGLALAGAPPLLAQQPNRQRNVITQEEIEPLHVEDAYQVVLRLRPEFLRSRASSQIRAAPPVPGEGRGTAGPEIQPSFAITRRGEPAGASAAQPPDPNAPEFTSQRPSGRSASRTSGAAGDGGFANPSAQTGVGVAGPARSDEVGIAVYVGNMMYGGIEELTRLPAAGVKEIRYLNPAEAQFRFGPRHGAGVILVTLK